MERVVSQKPVGHLVPQKLLTQSSTLLRFDDVFDSLIPIYEWRNGCVPKYCFVSHRWLFSNDPDTSLNTLTLILKTFASIKVDIEYFWIDYMCLPHAPSPPTSLVDSMPDIVYNATHLLIIPLCASKNTLVPKFDLQSYCFRAWCAFEFSAFMDRPENITIARTNRRGNNLKVRLLSLPCGSEDAKAMAMINCFVVLKDILLREDHDSFQTFYSTSVPKDMNTVWQMLNAHKVKRHLLKTSIQSSLFITQYDGAAGIDSESGFEHHLYQIKSVNGVEEKIVPYEKSGGMCECQVCCMM